MALAGFTLLPSELMAKRSKASASPGDFVIDVVTGELENLAV